MATKEEMIEQIIEIEKKLAKYTRRELQDYNWSELKEELSDIKNTLSIREEDYGN